MNAALEIEKSKEEVSRRLRRLIAIVAVLIMFSGAINLTFSIKGALRKEELALTVVSRSSVTFLSGSALLIAAWLLRRRVGVTPKENA